MSYMQHIQDHCKTAEDVRKAAIKSIRFRERLNPATRYSFIRPSNTTSSMPMIEAKKPKPPARDFLYVASENSKVDKFPPNFTKYIKRLVSKSFNYSQADMDSKKRYDNDILPRHTAIYLIKKFTPMSLPQIGRVFGNRDHGTIFHAVNKMPARMIKNCDLHQKVMELTAEIDEYLKKWRSE